MYMHILPFFKEYNLNELDADLIEEWQMDIIKSNKFSDTYLYTIQAQLNAILNYAFKKIILLIILSRELPIWVILRLVKC